MLDSTRSQQPKLLDEVRNVLRLHHYSIHTEHSYVEWIMRSYKKETIDILLSAARKAPACTRGMNLEK